MIKTVRFGTTTATCHCFSECPDTAGEEVQKIINALLEMLNEFLDDTYSLYVKNCPSITRPALYAYVREGKPDDCNAFTDGTDIFISVSLLTYMHTFIKTKLDIAQFDIGATISKDAKAATEAHILIYILQLIVAHELSHIWHGHRLWKRSALQVTAPLILDADIFSEQVITDPAEFDFSSPWDISNLKQVNGRFLVESRGDRNFLQQVLEMDADCFAMNLVLAQVHAKISSLLHRKTHESKLTEKNIQDHHGFLLGLLTGAAGIMCAFFDSMRTGKPFDKLSLLLASTHPVPAIRFFKMYTTMADIIHHLFPNEEMAEDLLSQRSAFAMDILLDDGTTKDLRNCFWAPVHTKEAQEFVSMLEHGWNYIRDSLQNHALLPLPFKYPETYMKVYDDMILYDRNGNPVQP